MRAKIAGLIFSLLACQPDPKVRNVPVAEAGVQLLVPADWRSEPASPQALLQLRPLRDGLVLEGAFLLLVRDLARPGVNPLQLSDYVRYQQSEAARFANGLELLEERPATLAGMPAWYQQREVRSPLHTRREAAWLWLRGGAGYQLLCAAPPESFGWLNARCSAIAQSASALGLP